MNMNWVGLFNFGFYMLIFLLFVGIALAIVWAKFLK